MTKGFIALLAFTIALLAAVPSIAASQQSGLPLISAPNDLQTKVLQDANGNVHVLWLVPARNNSVSGPGIWYSKYSPNGTDTIPPTKITNSSTIQSADLAVNPEGNAIIVWADDVTTTPTAYSILYMLHFNSTQAQTSKVLARHDSLILWPSLALGNNDSIYMTWTEYDPANSHAAVEYARVAPQARIETKQLASYLRADVFPPQANLVFDNSSQNLQIAWGESENNGTSASTVSYTKLGANGTILTQLQIAKFAGTLREVTMTGMTGQDGAFVVWRTEGSNNSLYVSQISPSGALVYVKQLTSPAGQSRYLAVSAGPDDNLYLVWYQPSVIASQTPPSSAAPSNATNMAYVRMSITGEIDQTGTGIFKNPIIGVAVLSDGVVYGVSPDGLVSVVTPTLPQNNTPAISALALMSCVGVASFAGSVLLEEGRYRWVALYSRISKRSDIQSGSMSQTLKLLGRRPGLRIREIKHFTRGESVNTRGLVRMERSGVVSSFRDGLSRRFYVRENDVGKVDALRTRILLWVLDHPGIWEAQLAKDLGLSQQIVHYHLKKLRETKLITAKADADGTRKLYRFADNGSENREATREQ
jgi:DNA-binding transcriptional ArsR family regulator